MAASSERRRKEILSYLRGKSQPITAAELGGRFDVSERTIYRDLDALRDRINSHGPPFIVVTSLPGAPGDRNL